MPPVIPLIVEDVAQSGLLQPEPGKVCTPFPTKLTPSYLSSQVAINRLSNNVGGVKHLGRLQLVHDPRARLHHPVPMPQQLPQISILPARHPDLPKAIFEHQTQNQLRVRFCFGFALSASQG